MERELVDDVPGHAQYHVTQNKQSVRFSKSVGCYSKLLVSYIISAFVLSNSNMHLL